jgi:peroxiredoxin
MNKLITPALGLTFGVGLLCLAGTAVNAGAAVKPGDAAPAFVLTDADGETHSLKDQAGKWVVLEWVNYDCPFVKRHYNSGSMPALQKEWRDKDVAWFSVNSSKAGSQGHFENPALKERIARERSAATAYLLDTDGKTGKAYGAQVTPHMFVINPEGKIVYAGAIDDKPTTKLADAGGATNHVSAALTAAMAGKPVSPAATKAYGCGVKY